jgi:hypothetical protein
MGRYYFSLLCMAFLIIFASIDCKNNSNPIDNSNNSTSQIIPLNVGNQWMRQITNYDTTGNMYYSKVDTIQVLRDTTIQSEKWWFLGAGIFTNRSDGFYDYESSSPNEISLLFKYPTSTNNTYTYRGTPMKVMSIGDSVSVPAGTFVCYHFRQGVDSVSYSDFYISPNIGTVKEECYNPLSGGRVYRYLTYILIKADIK